MLDNPLSSVATCVRWRRRTEGNPAEAQAPPLLGQRLEVRLSPLKAPQTTDEYVAAPSGLVTKLDGTTGGLNFVIPATIDPTEYGSIVIWCQLIHGAYAAAILSSLLVSCALVPQFEKAAGRIDARRAGEPVTPWFSEPLARQLATAARTPVIVAVVVIAVAGVVNTALLANNPQIPLIERGLTGRTVQ